MKNIEMYNKGINHELCCSSGLNDISSVITVKIENKIPHKPRIAIGMTISVARPYFLIRIMPIKVPRIAKADRTTAKILASSLVKPALLRMSEE